MKKVEKTDELVALMLERAQQAMPEIKRQIEVYEKSMKSGTRIVSPKVAPQFKHG